jgi:type VI secretion system protein
MLKGRKARYWEAYEQLYADIAEQAEQNFNELFASEFARAYQAQLKLLKSDRHQGG